jgi:uncharacterized phage protein (TIGR02218 family)
MSFLDAIKNKIVPSVCEVYEIAYGTNFYYYTSSDYDFNFSGNYYIAKAIKRSSIKQNENFFAGELTFSLPKTDDVSRIFRKEFNLPIFFKIYRIDKNDASQEKDLTYTGFINSAENDEVLTTFTCNTNEIESQNTIGQYRYSRLCPNDLYNHKCNVIKEDYTFKTTITGISDQKTSFQVTDSNGIGALPEDFFKNGFIQGDTFSSTINKHTGLNIKVNHPMKILKIGDTINLVAGCNRTSDDCKNKFNNFENFFGSEHVPNSNPFRKTL